MTTSSELELSPQLLLDQLVFQVRNLGQTILEWREALALDQRLQVVPAILGNAKAIISDVVDRHFLFLVGYFAQVGLTNAPAVGLRLLANDGGHQRLFACYCHFHGGLAYGIGLLHIGGRGNVPGGPLQVVSNGPVVLVSQGLFDHIGQCRSNTAQLGMAKGILGTGVGHKAAVFVLGPLRSDHHAVAVIFHTLVDSLQELLPVERNFGEQNDVRRLAFTLAGQATGRCNPARVPAHYFQDEHLGGGFAHGFDIQAGFQGRGGNVLGHRTEARAAVGERQIVIDSFGYTNARDRITHLFTNLGHLVRRILGVTAAVVEEVADIVGPEHFDQALVFALVLGYVLELVTARAKGAARRVNQRSNGVV